MSNRVDQFNAHQEDVRNRASALVKIILLLAGGTLSISIGIFVKNDAPDLSGSNLHFLRWSWMALFASIFFLITSLVTIIARDYWNGEVWRGKLEGERIGEKTHRVWIEVLIWGLAICGYVAFLAGMFGVAWISVSTSAHV